MRVVGRIFLTLLFLVAAVIAGGYLWLRSSLPQTDGTIAVRNACRVKDGSTHASNGVARTVEGKPAALRVRFAPAWLAWLPMAWADYWGVDLDADYQWAVVGGPSRQYMWVLSRRPSMSRTLFDQIKQRARRRGYPVDQLVMAAPLD